MARHIQVNRDWCPVIVLLHLYVIAQGEQGQIAEQRNVKTGVSRDGMTIISRGVEVGEQVVTSGQVKLRQGSVVSIAQAQDVHTSADDEPVTPEVAPDSTAAGSDS
jgi:hypothetical protein